MDLKYISMIKKFLGLFIFSSSLFASSLMELLDSVQGLVTEYETTGKALEQPYVYAKLESYYQFGKLYASYAMDKEATEMLSLASCSALNFDCKNYRYFLKKITYESFQKMLKKYPTLLGKTQASYNAYAEWWLKKHFSLNSSYKEFRNLEDAIKERFLNNWKNFLIASPKPLKFKILRNPCREDLFLLKALTNAYYQGWIKGITFYGDWGAFRFLYVRGDLPPNTKFVPYNKCSKYNFIFVY